MDKFTIIKIMNEAMIRLKISKNENCEKNEKIKKKTAIKVLINVGVNEEKLEETYQKLTEKNIYDNLIRKGKIDPKNDTLIVKYN